MKLNRAGRLGLGSTAFVAMAAVIGACAWWSWGMMVADARYRTDLCVELIFCGIGAAWCLGAAMHVLDLPLMQVPPPRWYVRGPIKLVRRYLMVLQLLVMCPALGAGMVLIYGDPLIDWVMRHLTKAGKA